MDYNELMDGLSELKLYAKENYIPIIRDLSAKFLYDFVKDNNIKTVLEIGTAIGYSGSIMISAGVERLITCDINDNSLDVARRTFDKLGISDRIDVRLQDAKDLLEELVDAGCKFDMVFLDGAKGQYINYLPNITKLIGVTGVVLADNVLLGGMVEGNDVPPRKKRSMVNNLRKYLARVNESDYDTEMVKIEDGLAITRYKGEE